MIGIYSDKISSNSFLQQVNLIFLNRLIETKSYELVYNNQLVVILKKIGDTCIESVPLEVEKK